MPPDNREPSANTPRNVAFDRQSAGGVGAGERRQATVLFADMAGFTAFSERFGEEAAYSLMQRVSELMTDAIHQQSGTVKSFTGDGVMAIFGVQSRWKMRQCGPAVRPW